MTKNNFTIFSADSHFELIAIIQREMKNGWEPIGGVAVLFGGENYQGKDVRFFHSMVKKEKKRWFIF